MKFKYKKILITGAAGYIGNILTELLLKDNYKVIALDRFYFGNKFKINKNLQIINADTRNFKLKKDMNIDAIIDLAAISNDPSGDLFPKATKEINYMARYNLAIQAKKIGVNFYLLPSSCSVYGFSNEISNEQSKTNPISIYAKYNHLAEKKIMKLCDNKFNITIIRQATVFGYSPRMRYDLAINALTYFAKQNNEINLMRDGNQWRPFVHVLDTSRAMKHLLEFDKEVINGQILNVGDNNLNFQIKKLGNIFSKNFKNVKKKWYGGTDTRSYKISFDKINELTGFECKYDLEYGIKEMIKKIEQGKADKTPETITLDWYKYLEECKEIYNLKSLDNKIINI
jgi:nucleoside-diphosphate-sugar epimerase